MRLKPQPKVNMEGTDENSKSSPSKKTPKSKKPKETVKNKKKTEETDSNNVSTSIT